MGNKKTLMKKIMFFLTLVLFFACYVYAGQSTIVVVTGNACIGDDKSRKQTEQEALIDAKRKAVEFAMTRLESNTTIKDFQLKEDIIKAYSKATIKILEEIEHKWYKDEASGDCFRETIKAEVIPDENSMENIIKSKQINDDPSAPLNINIWSDKKKYKKSEKVKIYIKGNKPFYARVIYKNAAGSILQLLPNPFRNNNYFDGGMVYEIPSGDDRFDLEVIPPYGSEVIEVYASTSQLGKIDLKESAAVYEVKTRGRDIGEKTRGVLLIEKGSVKKTYAEFSESSAGVLTLEY